MVHCIPVEDSGRCGRWIARSRGLAAQLKANVVSSNLPDFAQARLILEADKGIMSTAGLARTFLHCAPQFASTEDREQR